MHTKRILYCHKTNDKCSAVAEMGDRLATINIGQKLGGGAEPLLEGGAESPCNNAAWAEAYLRTKLHLDPSSRLATIDMGRSLGGLCPLGWSWVRI